jgi:Radical SAM superfamily/4Fe-4S single cluster domain
LGRDDRLAPTVLDLRKAAGAMIPIYENWCVQIDVTNHCFLSCLYCSRYNRHLRKDQRSHMSVEQFRTALDSLRAWPAKIGVIGGEPLLHPQFTQLCDEIRQRFPREKMALWTSGPKQFKEHRALVDATFGFVAYNEHNEEQQRTCKHQPLTVSIEEAVPDARLRATLIDDCWVQRTWCATINHFGAYFCEVAAAQDVLLNEGVNAWPVTPDWWVRTPAEFAAQAEKFCGRCGMALPIDRELIQNQTEKFSPGLLQLFRDRGLRKVGERDVAIFDRRLSVEEVRENVKRWAPGNYRGDLHEDGAAPEGLGFTKKLG